MGGKTALTVIFMMFPLVFPPVAGTTIPPSTWGYMRIGEVVWMPFWADGLFSLKMATLYYAIYLIVTARADEKMLGVKASRVIALVED